MMFLPLVSQEWRGVVPTETCRATDDATAAGGELLLPASGWCGVQGSGQTDDTSG